MSTTVESASKLSLPTSSTFSFTAPFPPPLASQSASKQRRVSLALPSTPRLVPAWSFRDDTGLDSHIASASNVLPEKRGKMRRIALDDDNVSPEKAIYGAEKRQRKKWTEEETQMLVDGCNTWGVGNWKAILNDPTLTFDNRSPVDLKDRFRTFFPDAYKLHYPNAKTHLSSKVRSTLPDGSSLFEKTRSKKRRPFTLEEDQALKAGYEKHGTVWSTIVKDPIFQEQKRRSTDLRDRFRNAFPHLYQAAGYKPRSLPKKKRREDGPPQPIRAATDDQLLPPRSRSAVGARRSRTAPGISQSVPQSVACSEDEDSSGGEEDVVEISRPTPLVNEATPQPEESTCPSDSSVSEVEMHTIDPLLDPLSLADFMTNSSQSMSESDQSQTWLTDRLGYVDGWSSVTTTASPTSSQISTADYFARDSPYGRRNEGFNMIGKSAWGPSDWLSGNPRLDPSSHSSGNSSFVGGPSPAPSSPFSFSSLSHGIMDRYDLYSTSFAHDFASEVGVGDSHSTFSDPEMYPTQSFRGFTHHSDYAGDLIFGARSHQPQGQTHLGYGLGFGHNGPGLGLSGMTRPDAGINPMQLHTPGLPGIDELELSSIQLDDHVEEDEAMHGTAEVGVQKDDTDVNHAYDLSALVNLPPQTLEEIAGLTTPDLEQDMAATPPATPVRRSRSPCALPNVHNTPYPSFHARSMSVPPNEHRSTPPPRALQQPEDAQIMPRSLSLYDASHDPEPAPLHVPSLGTAFDAAFRCPPDLYDLPFLDLHYYSGSTMAPQHHDIIDSAAGGSRHGQALDLAQTHASHSVPYAHAVTPTLTHTPHPPNIPVATSRPRPYHHRGQSVVSPREILAGQSNNDNKRKRVSWDGGTG